LLRLGRDGDALDAFRRARDLASDDTDRRFLDERIVALCGKRSR
jgi:predicted RNA polymerase sigma factor